ncbi:MAG TPA: O-antigen ligase family protein [Candidatus Hydrogenedentes bacterium]|nr:O-antigen ligase family protein [Candidatus Hydrogenedentota bacterium]
MKTKGAASSAWPFHGGTAFVREVLPNAATATAIAAVVVFAGAWLAPRLGVAEYDYLVGAGLVVGAAGAAFLVFGPSWIIISLFLAKMILGHLFLSMYIFPFAGVEWHPREFWLFLLLAHGAVKLITGRAAIRPDLTHYFFYLYCFYFVFIAAVGLWRQPNMTEIIKECRFPIFLSTYLVFATCVKDRRELRRYARALLALTTLIALGACAFFAYTFVTGNVINTQNVYGEYVRRQIGPRLLQSVRPNGHLFYEVCFVVIAALFFCRETTRRVKALYLLLLGVFGCAIVITMMRTAYVALACSLAILVFISLPRGMRWLLVFVGVLGVVLVALALGAQLYESTAQQLPDLEVSLKARVEEMRGAWDTFLRHPLTGAGMGSSFEGMGWVAKQSTIAYGQTTYQTVHNVWMYYLFKGGIVGMALVLAGLGGILARAYLTIERIQDARDRCLLRGLVAATAGQLVASLAMPRLTYPIGAVFLAMMTCAFFLLARQPMAETPVGPEDRPCCGY